MVVCWGWLVALCKPEQNSDSEFSVRWLNLSCRLVAFPPNKKNALRRPAFLLGVEATLPRARYFLPGADRVMRVEALQ